MNVLYEPGRIDRQPCEKCKVIQQSTMTDDGHVICSQCGAWWVSTDYVKHANESPGCALMVWSTLVAIALFGLWLASKLHGGVR
jgi:hypothetical protein